MAAATGKKESEPLSLFMEVNNLEIEAELSAMATLFWRRKRVDEQMVKGAADGVEETDL